ncbi:unnamed protein product, partial [Rotaria sp. Silwood2]
MDYLIISRLEDLPVEVLTDICVYFTAGEIYFAFSQFVTQKYLDSSVLSFFYSFNKIFIQFRESHTHCQSYSINGRNRLFEVYSTLDNEWYSRYYNEIENIIRPVICSRLQSITLPVTSPKLTELIFRGEFPRLGTCHLDLPLELFCVIFDYLAPHDLLRGFRKLNKRFTTMVKQQPLCLPNNRMMNFKLYHTYLMQILPKNSSKIVYLHLSERRAPDAVDWFVNKVPLNELVWPLLKAVTIEDIPCHLFETLLNDSSILSGIHSFSFDISYERYYHYDYEG